jgi:prepilin-type N-terminal cleavage/methylation domain-containing protein
MGNKGFTIVETMFAISIFAMGLMAAVQLHYSTARNNMHGNVLTMAHMAAKEELESFRSKDIWDLTPGISTKQVGVITLTTTITKSSPTARIGSVEVVATVKNKRVSYNTNINNNLQRMWVD